MQESNEDLKEIERAGRRCGACRSGRGWRKFEVVRVEGQDPVVLCGGCRARLGDEPSVTRTKAVEAAPAPKVREAAPQTRPEDQRPREQSPDRLRVALGKMEGVFSTAMVAREAGLSDAKSLARLQQLERRGEVRRVGKRWSTESLPSDIEAAMDRLAAQTSNLRIVREPSRVG